MGEGVYRPIFWEIAEEYEALNMTGPGKINFGEFNEEENEIETDDPVQTAELTFLNNDKTEFLTYSTNKLGWVEDENGKMVAGEDTAHLNREDMKRWIDHVYFSKLEGYVKPEEPKVEETKKAEDEIKTEL